MRVCNYVTKVSPHNGKIEITRCSYKAGKVALLKTAAQVVPNFWMNLLLIPLEICEGIERKMNAYWWSSGTENKGINWMSWSKLCEVKEEGGLGFKRLKEFNIAMLAKQGWRLINDANPLVTSLMKARYFPNTDFLNAQLGNNPSYIWRSIIEAQEVIKIGCRRKIGDGKSSRVWEVPWLPCPENGYLTTEMPVQLKDATVRNLLTESQREWDDDVLRDICNERDRSLILQIPVSSRQRPDSWFWLLEDKGQFTVRSCYRKLHGEQECLDKGFWKKLWSLNLPGKVLNFMWRTCRDVLPTAAALVVKRVNIVSTCSWCHQGEEDAMHVLFRCSYAKEVWKELGLQPLVQDLQNDTVMTLLKKTFHIGNTDQCAMVGLCCWCLWDRRNKWVWERANQSVFGIKAKTINMLSEWQKARLQALSDVHAHK